MSTASNTLSITNSSGNSVLTVNSGSSPIWATASSSYSGFAITPNKTTYHILGEDFSVDGYKDPTVAMNICLVNIHGRRYYNELLKQDIFFSGELKEIIERRLTVQERNQKIDSVVDDTRG